tara:strand:+ start:181 stop:402 length:222 start_codon:yes stop_codon:yes gene_type:complete
MQFPVYARFRNIHQIRKKEPICEGVKTNQSKKRIMIRETQLSMSKIMNEARANLPQGLFGLAGGNGSIPWRMA